MKGEVKGGGVVLPAARDSEGRHLVNRRLYFQNSGRDPFPRLHWVISKASPVPLQGEARVGVPRTDGASEIEQMFVE